MNFKVFEPLVKGNGSQDTDAEDLYLKGARGATGRGKRVTDGFVVFAGSEVASSTVPSFQKGFILLREELIANEIIKEDQGKFTLATDYLFSSPSAAAAVIMGRSANGLIEWKDKAGKSIKDIESAEIEKANKTN